MLQTIESHLRKALIIQPQVVVLKPKKDAMVVSKTNSNKSALRFWVPVIVWMMLIFGLSSIPGDNIPSVLSFQNTLYHFLSYLTLTILLSRAFMNTRSEIDPLEVMIFTSAFGLAYGFSDELHQAFIPFRSTSFFDIFIDGIGSLFGSGIYIIKNKYSKGVRFGKDKAI